MDSMSLYEKMKLGKFPVLVSLPRNDLSLAQAALDGGADGFKVHLNVLHRASGNKFGNFSEERAFFQAVSKLSGHKAVMIGEDTLTTAEELKEIASLGFESYDLYLKYAKPYLYESSMCPMLALGHGYQEEEAAQLSKLPECIVEASVVDPQKYGTPLEAAELEDYRKISYSTKHPVLVPTQKKILPEELARLREFNAGGILTGVIVLGSTAESISKNVKEFVRMRDQFFT